MSRLCVAALLLTGLWSACNRCPDGLERVGDSCRDLAAEARLAAAMAKSDQETAAAEAAQQAPRQAKVDAEERRYQDIKRLSAQNRRCEKEGCDLVPTTPNPGDAGIWSRGQARERLRIRGKIARNERITDEEQAMLNAADRD